MSIEWETVLRSPGYEWRRGASGASEQDIESLANLVGRPLPAAYTSLVRLSDGATIRYRDEWCVRLWRIRDIPQWATAYGVVTERMPNALVFADDGGDGGYIFDFRDPDAGAQGDVPVYTVDFTSIGWDDAFKVAEDFRSLLLRGPVYSAET